ncbi:hypothetical protein [Arabiibacter massiliensis]|uniref:hypothetical protein n=1 Tax=Arabiibacter massiliensis TaxID=1870985 RepID=UPI0009BAC54B|nr:hypothetical protein [Arabiibacter massiliensis]
MAKRDDKLTHAAHIKRHTVGTSNEISFSVLDAAKNALDGDDQKDSLPRFGRISLFTLPGRRKKPAGTPTKESGLPLSTGDFISVEDPAPAPPKVPISSAKPAQERPAPALPAPAKPKRSPEEEIARRKARRRLSRIAAVGVVAVATVALIVAGAGYLYHEHQVQQSNVATLDEALRLIADTDSILFDLNEAVSDPFGEGSADKRAAVEESLPSVEDKLAAADERARAALVELRQAEDKEAATQAVTAVTARRTLADQGMQILTAADEAQAAMAMAEAAWDQVIRADELARKAAALVADTTPENVQASKDVTNESLAAFTEAEAAFAEAQAAYPAADFGGYAGYIAKRQEALGHAVASDDAILAKDKEEAAAQNDAYNVADAEAAALAKELAPDPASVVREAYETTVEDLAKAYSTARLQAGAADAFIRDYLGTEIK